MKIGKEPDIRTREHLRQEERGLGVLIRTQENKLRERVPQLPGELLLPG
ncbi:MAG: hypothetical protein ABI813_06610 [Bacteroidota bacterium]